MERLPAPPDISPWSPRLSGAIFGGEVLDEATGSDEEDPTVGSDPNQALYGRPDIDTAMLRALHQEMVCDTDPAASKPPALGGRSDIDSAMLRALRRAMDVRPPSHDV